MFAEVCLRSTSSYFRLSLPSKSDRETIRSIIVNGAIFYLDLQDKSIFHQIQLNGYLIISGLISIASSMVQGSLKASRIFMSIS